MAASAKNNFDMNRDELSVAEFMQPRSTMKRFRAGAQGRASMILRGANHIGVTLKERKAASAVETVEEVVDGSERFNPHGFRVGVNKELR